MNNKKQEEHVKLIARYLESNEDELWSEILPILSQSHQQGRMEIVEEIGKEVGKLSTHYVCNCIEGQYDECPCWKGEDGAVGIQSRILTIINNLKVK